MQYTFEDQYKIKAKSECEIMDIYAIAQREGEKYRVWGRSEFGGDCPYLVFLILFSPHRPEALSSSPTFWDEHNLLYPSNFPKYFSCL